MLTRSAAIRAKKPFPPRRRPSPQPGGRGRTGSKQERSRSTRPSGEALLVGCHGRMAVARLRPDSGVLPAVGGKVVGSGNVAEIHTNPRPGAPGPPRAD